MRRNLLADSSSLSSTKSDTTSTTATWAEERKQDGKVRLAVVAGLFATIGSVLGKLAGSVEIVSIVALMLKGILLVLMITSNTVGCTFFVKALNASGSSLPCTIASAATSYVCSALAGFLVFNESTSITWWCGISFVILGLLFICNTPAKSDPTEKSKEQ
ncbi:transmembrane protein 42 [Hylaeus volcanicus]|uniref:transmembrane protein 42 n=1 Tax=Hylaeus volcanicus TaxID=313075 RepID=UPI0023B875CE|nr:transmembrane protein 42 [Hylaeus volcanicus]